jgi:hypothetical protein
MRISPIVCLTAVLAGFVSFAAAQESSIPPAHVSFVEGPATIERNGEIESAALNMPVVEGDRVHTSTGRLQIAFPDGSAADVEPNSDVEYLGGARLRIYAGTVENRPAVAAQSASAEYLPAESQAYAADLDQNGTWQYDSTYGNVWYPTVAPDWRPYYYGYWSSVPAYGWTWIGYNRWAWPTHHYGRWGYVNSRWFWIPGRVYSSAWVSWGTAPGYVSWCPLGWNSQPVAALSLGYSRGWNAWTIVPRDHFGWRSYPAHRYAVEPYRIAASTPFIVQRNAPPQSIRGSTGYVGTRAASVGRDASFSRGTVPSTASGSPRASAYSRSDNFSRVAPREAIGRAPAVRPSNQAAASRYQPQVRSYSSPSSSFQRSAPSSYQRSAPSSQPPTRSFASPAPSSQPFRSSREAPRPSYQSAPARQGGGGHPGNAPHADRGSSGGSHSSGSHGGGSHSGGSGGTAVHRSR